jgi:3-oxoacyl-[acyl-carrier protein] reductase
VSTAPDWPRELEGKTAVVTGSSAGIGRAIALELAAAGAAVVIHGRSRDEAAEQVADQIRTRGEPSIVIMADLADPATHQPLVDQAWNWRNGVQIWVNNAGADVLTGDAAGWSFDRKLDLLWRVDVRAAMRLSRSMGQRMKARQESTPNGDAPVILHMGWDQAECGMAGDSGEMFAAVKGAVMAFSRSLARSLAPHVRVNCLAPGWIRTAWGDQASDYWQRRAARESLLQRWGTPEDVARAARFLASPAAAFITGQVIPINGGLRIGDAGRTHSKGD